MSIPFLFLMLSNAALATPTSTQVVQSLEQASKEAINLSSSYLKAHPHDAFAWQYMARAYAQQWDTPKAQAAFATAESILHGSSNFNVLTPTAARAMIQKDPLKAYALLGEVHALRPENDNVINLAGEARDEMRRRGLPLPNIPGFPPFKPQ